MNAVRPGRPGSGAPMHQVANPVPLDHPARTAVVVDRDDAVRTAVASALDRMGFQVIGQSADRIAPVVVLSDDAGPDHVAAVRDAGAHGLLPAFPSRVALLPAIELAIA